MNADEIRAEAIARIASAMAAKDGEPEFIYGRHWLSAEAAVDALGDLLPTSAEWGYHCGSCHSEPDPCEPDEMCTYSGERAVIEKIRSGCAVNRRFNTDWRPFEGTEAA